MSIIVYFFLGGRDIALDSNIASAFLIGFYICHWERADGGVNNIQARHFLAIIDLHNKKASDRYKPNSQCLTVVVVRRDEDKTRFQGVAERMPPDSN